MNILGRCLVFVEMTGSWELIWGQPALPRLSSSQEGSLALNLWLQSPHFLHESWGRVGWAQTHPEGDPD